MHHWFYEWGWEGSSYKENTCQRNVPVAGVQDFEDHFYSLLFRYSFVLLVIHQGPRVDVCPRASPKVFTLEEETEN